MITVRVCVLKSTFDMDTTRVFLIIMPSQGVLAVGVVLVGS